MCNRRNKPFCQGAVFLALVGALGYGFYLYNIVKLDLEKSNFDVDKYFRQQESLSSQLQVVYEHRARLERSLQKEKSDHKNSKLDFSRKQNDFILNVTRSKHEAMNRFNSLETQHNMLKAQDKELQTEYNRLRQQYTRLSSEHLEVDKQQKRNFQMFKEQKVNEVASLDAEIKTLKQQVVSLRTHLKSSNDELEQSKLSSKRTLSINQRYQERIKTLQEQVESYKRLKSLARQESDRYSKTAEVEKQPNVEEANKRFKGRKSPDAVNRKTVEQEGNEKSRDERDIHEEADRPESRVHERRSSQDRIHYNQPTKAIEYQGFNQSDMRRPPNDLNTGGDAQDQSQPDHRPKHVPLKDREPGVEVVAPAEKVIHKWADVLKGVVTQPAVHDQQQPVAQQEGRAEEGNGEKEEEAEGEEEVVEEEEDVEDRRDKKVDEHQQQEAADRQPAEPGLARQPVNGNLAANQHEERVQRPEYLDQQIDRPVPRARQLGQDGQVDKSQADQEDKGQENHADQEAKEVNHEAQHEKDQGLSRQSLNEQMAEMQQKAAKRVAQEAAEVQREHSEDQAATSQLGGEQAARRHVLPIPAVKRDSQVDEEVKEPADERVDNDDEEDDNERDTEDEADEADDEDDGNIQPQANLPQPHARPLQGQLHEQNDDRRSMDRTLKGVDSAKEQSRQEAR